MRQWLVFPLYEGAIRCRGSRTRRTNGVNGNGAVRISECDGARVNRERTGLRRVQSIDSGEIYAGLCVDQLFPSVPAEPVDGDAYRISK
jgi:hypothetical protein